MDLDPPQLTEERRIVATDDALDEIVLSLSAPKDVSEADWQGRITARMVYGGEIVEERHPGRSHADFVMRLPEPLTIGERHEYSVQLTSYPRRWLRPYYVLTPWRPCRTFGLRVRFDPANLPVSVWRIAALAPTVLDDFQPTGEALHLDNVGEVQVEFHDLRQAVSYGVGWEGCGR
jgi:hypothetical protein